MTINQKKIKQTKIKRKIKEIKLKTKTKYPEKK